jgi:hypothetical protein
LKVPSIIFLFTDYFLILTTADLTDDRSDLKFESLDLASLQFFIESVFMHHWGETSIFASRIVVSVRFRSILYIEQTARQISIWLLHNGLFNIRPVDQSSAFLAAIARTDGRLPPSRLLHRIRNEDELWAWWRTSEISANEYLLRLNGLRSRSFIDLEEYPIFPDFTGHDWRVPNQSEIIGMMSAVNPFHAFDRFPRKIQKSGRHITIPPPPPPPPVEPGVIRSIIPANFYFHAVGDADSPISMRQRLESDQERLVEWISRVFQHRLTSHQVTQTRLGDFELKYLCQRMTVHAERGKSLVFDGDGVINIRGIVKGLDCIEGAAVCYEPSEVAISVGELNRTNQSRMDPLLGFVKDIEIGRRGLFFIADLTVGMTLGFRVEYQGETLDFSTVARFESDDTPTTCVSDLDLMAATFCGESLTFWYLPSGMVHRKLELGGKVRAASFDEEFSCLFVATSDALMYVNVNGDILCESSLEDLGVDVTTMRWLYAPLFLERRVAICGGPRGEVWLARTDFEAKTMEVKNLESLHQARVERFIVHRMKTAVMSIDEKGEVCFWSCVELLGPKMKPEQFVKCACCEKNPVTMCGKCSKMLCGQCGQEHNQTNCPGLGSENTKL